MRRIVLYTLAIVLLAGVGFILLLLSLPTFGPSKPEAVSDAALALVFVLTTAVMFVAGILGGCLYNLRGLSKHSAAGDFHQNYILSYYLRPLSGGVSGLIVFFLLLGGALTLNVGTSSESSGTAIPAWASLLGRMPYIAFSLLAGYGSHEFMLKLKDLADSFFALRRRDDVE